MKDGGFSQDKCNDWSSYEQLTNHKKSHRQYLGYSAGQTTTHKIAASVVEKCGLFSHSADGRWWSGFTSVFTEVVPKMRTDGRASLPFMRPINIFSAVFALPRLRINTASFIRCKLVDVPVHTVLYSSIKSWINSCLNQRSRFTASPRRSVPSTNAYGKSQRAIMSLCVTGKVPS